MLFQPTNITPDVINGIGNGTIDVADGLTVSWQVNGNSAMVAYQIIIYENSTDDQAAYNSGKQTITPFYGVDSKGNMQIFTATKITSSALSTAGITNGNQYYLVIRQYWLEGSTEKHITQKSMSVFKTRSTPSVSITLTDADGSTVSGSTLGTRSATATGTYSQAENDPIEWIQWGVYAVVNAKEVTMYDSGKIYGTGDMQLEYDGFTKSQSYRIRLTVETTNGITATATKQFSTSWQTANLPAEASACKLNNQSTAMKVQWYGFKNIKGEPSGNYSFRGGTLLLPTGSTVAWKKENGVDLSIATPWVVVIQSTLQKASVNPLIQVKHGSSTFTVAYDMPNRSMKYTINSTTSTLTADYPWDYEGQVTVIITPTKLYIRSDYWGGGLVPSNTRTPSNSLVPSGKQSVFIQRANANISYSQYAIKEINIAGSQNVNYIQVLSNYTQDELDELISRAYTTQNIGGYNPDNGLIGDPPFLALFRENSLDAGTLIINGTSIDGWAVYRRKETDPIAVHLADLTDAGMQIIDYGCGNMNGMYHYEIYPIGDKKYITNAIVTNSFNPCFENWSVLETTYDEEHDCYIVQNEFVFGKNLSSNSVTNNNQPTVYKNFTQYPTVLKATSNYQSGTLSSLIGYIGYISYIVQNGDTLANIAKRFNSTTEEIIAYNSDIESSSDVKTGVVLCIPTANGWSYYDDKKLRDAIWNLSMSTNPLFLKSRKGDVIEISTSQDVSMSYMDGTAQQVTTVSFPWVQIDDATDKRILGVYTPFEEAE